MEDEHTKTRNPLSTWSVSSHNFLLSALPGGWHVRPAVRPVYSVNCSVSSLCLYRQALTSGEWWHWQWCQCSANTSMTAQLRWSAKKKEKKEKRLNLGHKQQSYRRINHCDTDNMLFHFSLKQALRKRVFLRKYQRETSCTVASSWHMLELLQQHATECEHVSEWERVV